MNEDQLVEAIDRAAAATKEAPVVGRVFCAVCGGKRNPDHEGPLAQVWETGDGLYYEAELLGGTTNDPAVLAAQRGSGRRFLGARGLVRYLLEHDPKWQDRLQAECPMHGPADLDPVAVALAVRHRTSKGPALYLIHTPGGNPVIVPPTT